MDLPETYLLAYSRDHIQKSVATCAQSISEWCNQVYDDTGKPVVVVCVLKGAFMFFSDLIKDIDAPVESAFVSVNSYENNEQLEETTIEFKDTSVDGRHVLIVDDILDTGTTLTKLTNDFSQEGAIQVKTSVLIYKNIDGSSSASADWFCFEHTGESWLLGYGMDDMELYRNLKDVYEINS
jgi:hypoxanthine phosphoribosyltransferase